MERVLKRVAAIKHGDPLDPSTMMGAQASKEQLTKILSWTWASRKAPRC
jgi:aldehyde dehydrogenase